jgi:uncharacterized membrane protein
MNDPVVQSLKRALAVQGEALLRNPAALEKELADVAASFPGKVKALSILLDKKAVTYLTSWSKDARPNKSPYDQVRQQIAEKFEQAKLLNTAAAGWALDAWAAALGLRQDGKIGAFAAATPAGAGLSPAEQTPKPAAAAVPGAARASAEPMRAQANPYAPPSAPVADPLHETDSEPFVEGGRSVAAGRGWSWFAGAWALFKESPLIWIVNFVLFMVIVILVQLVPFLGGLAGTLLGPVLGAGIVIGAHAVHQGEALRIGHLFAGFRERTATLLLVGLLYLVGALAIGLVIVLGMMPLAGVTVLGSAAGAAQPPGAGLLLVVLIGLALAIPLLMAYWFAPALVALNGLGAVDAMKTSFLGCLKNILPFLVYGLIGFVLAILAVLPLGLGLLILGPVGMASIYTSYRDVFYED